MPEILVLTRSCARDRANGRQRAAADTWVREWGHLVTHLFVLGSGNHPTHRGEIMVLERDDYEGAPWKTRAAVRFALDLGYRHLFYCDIDTYVCVPRLLAENYKRAPYIGLRCDEGHASGGAGYWLNRQAMEIIAKGQPGGTYDDLWIGHELRSAGIDLFHDGRHYGALPNPVPDDLISVHLGTATNAFDPEVMRSLHAQVTGRPYEQG